jgi:hypothetical protein
MSSTEFDVLYFLRLFQKKAGLMLGLIAGCTAVFCLLYMVMPKKYKSDAQLTIYSKYFTNPLIRDFISEQYDPTEMRTQREAIIQQSLDDAFLDKVGTEFSLFKYDVRDPKHGFEREELRKHFETFSLNADTYTVGFVWKSPELAEKMAKRALDNTINTLVEQRRKTIVNVRNAIRARMEAMALFGHKGGVNNNLASMGRVQVEGQLMQIRNQIAVLLQQYTELHPRVIALRHREQVLTTYLAHPSSQAPLLADDQSDDAPSSRISPETLAGSTVEAGSKEIYQDLLKKYNYLNVAIDMEKTNDVNYYGVISAPTLPLSPVAPKLINFVAYGLGSGILLALFTLLFEEFVRFNEVDAEKSAKSWGIPLLGIVPGLMRDPELSIDSLAAAGKEQKPQKQVPNDWN